MFDHHTTTRRARPNMMMAALAQFRKDDLGSASLLAIFFFLMIMMVAGLGVDTARQEMKRAEIQSVLDRAVLAGAGAPQDLSDEQVEAIVTDYFAKSGMSAYLTSVDAGAGTGTSLFSSSRVYADAQMDVDTAFLTLAGINTLSASGSAQAEYATPRLEVSLVLDVSGSMRNKMDEMKAAAKSFVTTILSSSTPGNAYISVVPYAMNVTPGQDLFNALTVDTTHNNSTCLHFAEADYMTAAISPTQSYEQMIYTSVYGVEFNSLDATYRSCYTDAYSEIMPYSTDVTQIHAKIDSLVAEGNTSSNIGMKWGAALVDPAFQPVVTTLQSNQVVDTALSNMPGSYHTGESLKIIVLMADGYNTTSYLFDPQGRYKAGNSGVIHLEYADQTFEYAYKPKDPHDEDHIVTEYLTIEGDPIPEKWDVKTKPDEVDKCEDEDWFCVFSGGDGETLSGYFIKYEGELYHVEADDWLKSSEYNAFVGTKNVISETDLTWPEAWGLMSPQFYSEVTDEQEPYEQYLNSGNENRSYKDIAMQNVCLAARNNGVIIYTIGYDIDSGGHAEEKLQDCATSQNHYFPVSEFNISSAFGAIASNVQNLRLTQ